VSEKERKEKTGSKRKKLVGVGGGGETLKDDLGVRGIHAETVCHDHNIIPMNKHSS